MLEGLARFQEYMVRYGWEMCFPWYVRLVWLVGTVGYGWLVRLVRLVPFVGTLEPYQPYPETVPMNRTTVPYQIKGGVKGGGVLDVPLVRYGGTVHWCGFCLEVTVGTVGTVGKRTKRTLLSVPTVPTVPYQAYKAYQPHRTKRTNRTNRTKPTVPGF